MKKRIYIAGPMTGLPDHNIHAFNASAHPPGAVGNEGRDEMNGPITTEETYHISNILKHYAHAKEKHPYFCDKIAPVDIDKEDKEGLADYRDAVKRRLSDMRSDIEKLIKKSELDWNDLVMCELWEVDEAIADGDTAHAVEELYDACAVLLRAIDVLEGRQPLGKPEGGKK